MSIMLLRANHEYNRDSLSQNPSKDQRPISLLIVLRFVIPISTLLLDQSGHARAKQQRTRPHGFLGRMSESLYCKK